MSLGLLTVAWVALWRGDLRLGRVVSVPPRRGPGPGSRARTGGSRSAREGRAKQHRRCERETQRDAIARRSAWLVGPSAAFLRSRALFPRDPFMSRTAWSTSPTFPLMTPSWSMLLACKLSHFQLRFGEMPGQVVLPKARPRSPGQPPPAPPHRRWQDSL